MSANALPVSGATRGGKPAGAPIAWAYALLVAVAVFWGASFVAARVALREITPTNLVTLRFALAAFIFAPIAFAYHRRGYRIEARDWWRLALLAWLGVSTYFPVQYQALKWTTATRSTIIITSNPLFTLLWAHLLLGERPGRRRLGAVALALAGVLLVVWPVGGLASEGRLAFWGDLLILSNAVIWALYSVLGQRLMRRYPALLITAWIGLIGGGSLLPFALSGGLISQAASLSAISWWMVVFLALFASGVGYLGWFAAIGRVGPARASVFLYLEPLAAATLGILFLGETLTLQTSLGGAITLAGVYLTTRT